MAQPGSIADVLNRTSRRAFIPRVYVQLFHYAMMMALADCHEDQIERWENEGGAVQEFRQ